MSKPVLPANRRRKGFESVRKGYRSADARLLFFEKELFYSKLTVASNIRKELLHVSFGVVRSGCCGVLKKAFSLSDNFAGDVKAVLFRKTKVFHLQKASRFALKNLSFSQPKHRLFEPLFTVRKSCLFTYKNLSFAQTFPYFHPKLLFSTLRRPFQPPLTYCPQRIQPFF